MQRVDIWSFPQSDIQQRCWGFELSHPGHASMVNLILGLLVMRCSFFCFIHSKREQELSFAPDTIHNQATLGIVHHRLQIVLRKSLVGLHSTMVFFAARGGTNIPTFEIEIIVALQADCRIRNSFFHDFLSNIVNFQKLVRSLISTGELQINRWRIQLDQEKLDKENH